MKTIEVDVAKQLIADIKNAVENWKENMPSDEMSTTQDWNRFERNEERLLYESFAKAEALLEDKQQLTTQDKQPDCPCTKKNRCINTCPHGLNVVSGVCLWCLEHYKDITGYS